MQHFLDLYWWNQLTGLNSGVRPLLSDYMGDQILLKGNQLTILRRKRKINSKITENKNKVRTTISKLKLLLNELESEPNVLIKKFYKEKYNTLINELRIWQIKRSAYSSQIKNQKIKLELEKLFPHNSKKEAEMYINEFVAFMIFLKKNTNYFYTDYNELITPDFYGLNKFHLPKIDFKITLKNYEKISKGNKRMNRILNAHSIKDFFEDYLKVLGLSDSVQVKLKRRKVFSVSGVNTIIIPRKAEFPFKRLLQTANHEILCHVFRGYIGAKNSDRDGNNYKFLQMKNPTETSTEEGIATFLAQNSFYKSNRFDIPNLFNLYLRVITYCLALKFEPHIVFNKVTKLTEFESFFKGNTNEKPEQSRKILITRVYRNIFKPAKGFANPYIMQYLVGNRMVWNFIENGFKIDDLFIGKISIENYHLFKNKGFTTAHVSKYIVQFRKIYGQN